MAANSHDAHKKYISVMGIDVEEEKEEEINSEYVESILCALQHRRRVILSSQTHTFVFHRGTVANSTRKQKVAGRRRMATQD